MSAHVRVLILAVLTAGGVLAASEPAQAQHHHGYGGFSGGHYGGYTGPGSGYHGGYAPSYHPARSYGYPAGGHDSLGRAYYQPYTWHAGATHTPSYHGVFYHTSPTRFWGGHQRRYVVRH